MEEDDSKENFLDCFEDEDDIIANVDNHDELRDDDFVWGLTKTKEPATLSFNEVENSTVLLHVHDAKNLTVE